MVFSTETSIISFRGINWRIVQKCSVILKLLDRAFPSLTKFSIQPRRQRQVLTQIKTREKKWKLAETNGLFCDQSCHETVIPRMFSTNSVDLFLQTLIIISLPAIYSKGLLTTVCTNRY